MAEVYKNFNAAEDVIVGDIQTVSAPLWSENVNPLSDATAGAGIGFFTSSVQSASSAPYYIDVYHRDPATETNAAIQFSIAYGNIYGSGSAGDPNTIGQNVDDTPTRAIYGQYRNLLLPPTDPRFSFNGTEPDDIMVLNIARARYRQKIDPGNWTLKLGTNFVVTDDSGASDNYEIGAAGRIFNIRSGSNGEVFTSDANYYGLFYPDAGIMVFNATLLDTSANLSFTKHTAFNNNASNNILFFNILKTQDYFAARSEEKVNSTHYFVRVTNKQFNYSNNPTYVTGSLGQFLHPTMQNNPSVYITTVGMYDNVNRLVAVAKLSQPLLKSFNREVLIKVKLDY